MSRIGAIAWCSDLLPSAIDDHHYVGMIMVKKKKVAAVKVLDGGDYSDYSTIEAMYV